MASQCTAEFTNSEDIENLKKLQDVLPATMELMANQIEYENTAIFIGVTESGESTLIDYLLGNSLVGVQSRQILPITIQKADDSDGPQIERGHSPDIIIPTRRVNPRRLPGLTIWNVLGFDVKRDKVQDIINAFFIYELFKNIQSVKIVLVVDIQHVMRKPIDYLLPLLKSVESLFQRRIRDCFRSIVVIFTNIDESIEIHENFLNELLEPILNHYDLDISLALRDYVRYLSEHPEKVGFFKQANEGLITDDIDLAATDAIQRASSVPGNILKDVSFPSIADSSKLFLCKCRDKIFSASEFNMLQITIGEVFQEILHEYTQIHKANESRNQLVEVLEKLNVLESQIEQVLNSSNILCKKLNSLKNVHPKIKQAISRGQLAEKTKVMEFIDNVLDIKESKHFNVILQSIMVTVRYNVKEMVIHIKLSLDEIEKKRWIVRWKK